MHWKYATQQLAVSVNHVAHASAAVIVTAGIFANRIDSLAAAALTWVLIRTFGYILQAVAGPPNA
ncbi:hypothetical protein GGI1_08194 [Acidithiobacillus sp. GGI-221]|uniref:Uncharacterized protein n=1 Tax=mine drainage metagenome TaxID=410659 RepID=E6QVR5_9ZZZZ|nr:hypothetical protein GGI1_08194 [Acidithiobacillus sp. GGI-221]